MNEKKIELEKEPVKGEGSKVQEQIPGAPEVPGSYTLSKDRKYWIPNDEPTKKKVEAYRKEFGDRAIKKIQIK